jgi:hypothetical protein
MFGAAMFESAVHRYGAIGQLKMPKHGALIIADAQACPGFHGFFSRIPDPSQKRRVANVEFATLMS